MKGAALAVCLLLAGCAHVPRGPRGAAVEAEGWAPLSDSGPGDALRRALADAQRRAVEKATGVSLRARTRVDRAVAVEDSVSAAVAGRILSYELLERRREGGELRVRIRAVVARDGPARPLRGVRVAVVIDSPEGQAAARGLRQALLEAGLAPAFGQVELVVSGRAEVRPQAGVEGFASSRARLAFELRDPAEDELLASRSVEASAIDPSPEIASAKALERAGVLAGEAVVRDAAARR